MNTVENNLRMIWERIHEAAARSGRKPESITLVAVSKAVQVVRIAEAVVAGQLQFGENYVQEFLAKHEDSRLADVKWHFVGRLQSNKVKRVVGKTHLVQSVSSLVLASEISKQAVIQGAMVDCLLQINISQEGSKSGFAMAEAEEATRKMSDMPNLCVKGYMAIASEDERKVISEFRDMRRLFENLSGKAKSIIHLSMGMTNDFDRAIEEGATIIRIGTALFGKRKTVSK